MRKAPAYTNGYQNGDQLAECTVRMVTKATMTTTMQLKNKNPILKLKNLVVSFPNVVATSHFPPHLLFSIRLASFPMIQFRKLCLRATSPVDLIYFPYDYSNPIGLILWHLSCDHKHRPSYEICRNKTGSKESISPVWTH